MDLSDNKTPFGLLTPEEQEHLRNWPHGVQMYRGQIGWIDSDRIAWAYFSTNTYRTKPAPKPLTRVEWINDYGDFGIGVWLGVWHDSRESADDGALAEGRIGVIRREWAVGQPPKYFTEEL